jgi:hypothetical protein
LVISINAQEPIPKDFKPPKTNDDLKANWETDIFNDVTHPLAITGGILAVGGEVVYIAGSLREGGNNGWAPTSNLHYIGIGAFFTGVVLFAIFSTEREKGPKHKKVKQKYNTDDWEAPK